jgi:hypothetical protein
MATQTFACPACGSRKVIEDPQSGEKIHCTCGMSYPASPVFAIADAGNAKSGGPGVGLMVGLAMLIGFAGAAAWLVTRPKAGQPDRPAVAKNDKRVPVDHPTEAAETATKPTTDDGKPKAVATTETPPKTTTPDSTPPTSGTATENSPGGSTPTTTAVNPPTPPPAPTAPGEALSAVKLWDAFDLDPDAASARYTGKMIEVTARGKLARDYRDKPYFGAEVVKPRGRLTSRMTPNERQWETEGYPPNVRCYLSPDQEAALEKVSPGQEVVLRGVCTGRKTISDVYRGYIVELEDCTVMVPK